MPVFIPGVTNFAGPLASRSRPQVFAQEAEAQYNYQGTLSVELNATVDAMNQVSNEMENIATQVLNEVIGDYLPTNTTFNFRSDAVNEVSTGYLWKPKGTTPLPYTTNIALYPNAVEDTNLQQIANFDKLGVIAIALNTQKVNVTFANENTVLARYLHDEDQELTYTVPQAATGLLIQSVSGSTLTTTTGGVYSLLTPSSQVDFATVADMLAGIGGITEGQRVTTLGYHKAFDGGGMNYGCMKLADKASWDLIDEVGNFTSSDGNVLIAQHVTEGVIDAHGYGAKGDVHNGNGTNDRPAFLAALLQAKAFKSRIDNGGTYAGAVNLGWTVEMGARSYGVLVTQEEKDAGIDCAVAVPARCGLIGVARNLTAIVALDGCVGHVVANEQWATKGFDDFLTVQNFTVFCKRWNGCPDIEDGIHIDVAFNGYLKVDNFSRFSGLLVDFAGGNGFFFSGRGEMLIENCQSNGANYNWWIFRLADSHFIGCNAGGSRFTGFYLYKPSALKFTNCKSFYSGLAGGDDYIKCANWAITGDSWLAGTAFFVQCEGQESRGSSWYIATGCMTFTNCLGQDPKREALAALGTPPDICAAFHLAKGSSGWVHETARANRFENCIAQPGLALNYANLNGKSYAGTHAVYLDAGTSANTGKITTFLQSEYELSCVGGPGAGGLLNPDLQVDMEFLNDGRLPTGATVFIKPSNGGFKVLATQDQELPHKVTDYLVKYRDPSNVAHSIFLDVNLTNEVQGVDALGAPVELLNGETYTNVTVTPVNKLGLGVGSDMGSVTPQVFTDVYIMDGNLNNGHWVSDKPLINLDEPNINITFEISDRTNISDDVQSVFRQGDDSNVDVEFAVFGEYNYRLNLGGNQIIGGGTGKKLTAGVWTLLIQPVGVFLFLDGIQEGGDPNFVRGDQRSGGANMFIGNFTSNGTALASHNLEGAIRSFKTDVAEFILDHPGDNVSEAVRGDLTAVMNGVNITQGNWEVKNFL